MTEVKAIVDVSKQRKGMYRVTYTIKGSKLEKTLDIPISAMLYLAYVAEHE